MRFAIARALLAASPAFLLLFHAWFLATASSIAVTAPPARTTALPPPRFPSRSGRIVPDSPALSSSRTWHRRNSPDLPGSDLDEPAPPSFTATRPSARPGPAMPAAPAAAPAAAAPAAAAPTPPEPTPVGRRVIRRLPDPDSAAAAGASSGRRGAVMTERSGVNAEPAAQPALPAVRPAAAASRSAGASGGGGEDDDDDDDDDGATTSTGRASAPAPAGAARARPSRADRGAWGPLALPPGSDGISVGDPFYRLSNPYGTPTLTRGGAGPGAGAGAGAGDGLLRTAATPDSPTGAEAAVAGAGAGAAVGAGVPPADACSGANCDIGWRSRRRVTTFALPSDAAARTGSSAPAAVPVPVAPPTGVPGTAPALIFPRRTAPAGATPTSTLTRAPSTTASRVPPAAAVTAPRTAAVTAPPVAAASVRTPPTPAPAPARAPSYAPAYAPVYAVAPAFIAPSSTFADTRAYAAPVIAPAAAAAPPPRLPPGRNGGGESGTEGWSGTENYSGTEGYSAAAETPVPAAGHAAAEGTAATVDYSAATDYSAAAAPVGAVYTTLGLNSMFDDLAPAVAPAAAGTASAAPARAGAGGRGYGRARPAAATGARAGVSEALGAAVAGGNCGCEEGRPCTVTARTNVQDAEAASARFRRQLNAWAARRGGVADPSGRRDNGLAVMGQPPAGGRATRVSAAPPAEEHWWDGLSSAADRAGSGLRSSADEAGRSVRAGAEDARRWLRDRVERAREWARRAGDRTAHASAGAARSGADAADSARGRIVNAFSANAYDDSSSSSGRSSSTSSGRSRSSSGTRRVSSEPVSPAGTGSASARAGGGGSDGDELGRRMRLLHGCCSLDCVEVCSPDVGMYQPDSCAAMVAACDAAKTYDTEYVGPVGGVVAT